MLSIEYDHELFQFLSTPPQQQNIPPQSFITTVPKSESTAKKSSRKRKSSFAFSDIIHNNESPEDYAKKIIHRDVERQRRREMSILYQSLGSLVPDEYLPKRSVSDQVHGTVNYVRHLKARVDDIINKRDELQNLMNLGKNSSSCIGSDFSISQGKTSVAIRSSATGIQVILKTSLVKGLPLSKLLSALNGEGMAVISCISTRANQEQFHLIESEIVEGRSVHQTMLWKRLRDLVYNL